MSSEHNRFDADAPYQGTSDPRHSNGMAMRPTLDGINLEDWVRDHGRMTPTVPVIEGPPTERPLAPEERWPTLCSMGVAEALDVVERVAAFNRKGKYPDDPWRQKSITHHDAKGLWHHARAQVGEQLDHETNEPHRAHAILRFLMSLGLELDGT